MVNGVDLMSVGPVPPGPLVKKNRAKGIDMYSKASTQQHMSKDGLCVIKEG